MLSGSGRRCGVKPWLRSTPQYCPKWMAMAMLACALMQLLAKHNIVRALSGDGSPARAYHGHLRAAALEPARWPRDALTIANLGHSTLLMNFFGVRVISDPSLFERVGVAIGPLATIGPHRA